MCAKLPVTSGERKSKSEPMSKSSSSPGCSAMSPRRPSTRSRLGCLNLPASLSMSVRGRSRITATTAAPKRERKPMSRMVVFEMGASCFTKHLRKRDGPAGVELDSSGACSLPYEVARTGISRSSSSLCACTDLWERTEWWASEPASCWTKRGPRSSTSASISLLTTGSPDCLDSVSTLARSPANESTSPSCRTNSGPTAWIVSPFRLTDTRKSPSRPRRPALATDMPVYLEADGICSPTSSSSRRASLFLPFEAWRMGLLKSSKNVYPQAAYAMPYTEMSKMPKLLSSGSLGKRSCWSPAMTRLVDVPMSVVVPPKIAV
mmetsp:Transcript_13447/g.36427  ORF Transcript_13447/g.36427 Transcript_13447/m.36427 type:complete len:320 (+) Transcript_13447:1162-2121(+)